MISLSLECGVAEAEVECNDDFCPCAPGACEDGGGGFLNLAPGIEDVPLTAGVPLFIYLGKWRRTHKQEEKGKRITDGGRGLMSHTIPQAYMELSMLRITGSAF